MAEFTIPSPLKFLMSNLKLIVNIQLNNENYSIWKLQIYKLFFSKRFDGYLTETVRPAQEGPSCAGWTGPLLLQMEEQERNREPGGGQKPMGPRLGPITGVLISIV
ncbi:hypothetical protein M5K25_000074 [Dendrobium thyrsiflorum]|uniref:Retrotransposon Copia-like N-terminal domain-containing protein n=1 Tax=Dendrobium thyrsiflorum TaxID=117978 RepID=A0ABD0VUH2_DENTH